MADPLQDLPCGIVDFDDGGLIRYANATVAGWLGETADAMVGRKFESILSIANKIFFQTHFFPMLTLHGHAEEIFLMLLASNGDRIPVVACAQRTSNPGPPRSRCVLLTVHQRRKYEDEILQAKAAAENAMRNNDELRQAQRELEARAQELDRTVSEVQLRNEDLQRVAQILSQELGNPIRRISGLADWLHGRLKSDAAPEPAAAAHKIASEAAQMDGILRAVRQFLQLDLAANPWEKVDLKPLIEKAAQAVGLRLGFAEWTLECERLPHVEGQRPHLEHLFTELLENAVKFREPSRPLRVVISGRELQQNAFAATRDRYQYIDVAQIEVKDNGSGFESRHKAAVFQLLKKVDPASPGLGVGLALCRKIVAMHFGTIRVDPEPGVGTIFTIVLPLVQSGRGSSG